MKKFLVAGILGTMLALTQRQVAQAHDRFEPYRPTVYGSVGYRYHGHDGDYGRCDPRLQYPWPTYESRYLDRPYASTYRYDSGRFFAPAPGLSLVAVSERHGSKRRQDDDHGRSVSSLSSIHFDSQRSPRV